MVNPDVSPCRPQSFNRLLVLQLGYLVGVPVTGYSLELGREHTEFAEAKIQVCASPSAPLEKLENSQSEKSHSLALLPQQ